MMPLRLRDGLHGCVCDGRLIFLDIEADRYFDVSPAAEEGLLRLMRGEAEPQDYDTLASLTTRGLLVEDPSADGLHLGVEIPAATGDLLCDAASRAGVADVVRALKAEAGAAWRMKLRSFANVIAWAGRSQNKSGQDGADRRLPRLVAASAAASYFVRATDRCLVRALALHSTCKRFGIRTQLVLGVRINPFAAHCWVQQDDVVLIGDFEQVRLFTPIKAVR